MGDGFGMLLVVVVGGLSLVALFAVCAGLFPRQVGWTRRAADGQASRSFLTGLANAIFVAALALGAGALAGSTGLGFLSIVALILLVVLAVGAVFGMVGMAEVVGERLFPGMRPLNRTLGGGAALLLACLAPYLGWFGLLPYALLRGLGGFILGYFAERGGAKPSPAA